MSFYPYNTNVVRSAQTDSGDTIETALLSPVLYAVGSPAAADDDFLVASANMKVGAYTLLNSGVLAVARNATVTHTQVGGVTDTLGTVIVVGTDISGAAITETITPSTGAVVQGAKAFKTVTSVTGAGWVINTGNDTIKVGMGDVLGLPDKLGQNSVIAAYLNGVREATAPTVTFSSSVLSTNTIDLNSACDGNAVKVLYCV